MSTLSQTYARLHSRAKKQNKTLKTFYCDSCGGLVFFENTRCLRCDAALGFLPDLMDLSAVVCSEGENCFRALATGPGQKQYRRCANGSEYQVCNWMVPAECGANLCEARRLNKVIPNLSVPAHHDLWHTLEKAKRRVLYTLKRLGAPIQGEQTGGRHGLSFSFLADPDNGPKIKTGHANGLITINIMEADDAFREQQRVALKEPYRTPLGHVRHEVGHYYWYFLLSDSPHLDQFHKLFGDETLDYEAALQKHYHAGVRANWNQNYVSVYARVHPFEDWAETFAHYLHIVDMVETASSFGLSLKPKHPASQIMTSDLQAVDALDPHFDETLKAWFPLTCAMNELNRGMGLADVYPFVLSDVVLDKLRFIHRRMQEQKQSNSESASQVHHG